MADTEVKRDKHDQPSKEMLEKLPKWAQEYIKHLETERYVSVRALNAHCNQQTPSKMYWDDYVCTGETQGPSNKRFYVQTHRIVIEHAGVQLNVSCDNDDSSHDAGIGLQWSDMQRLGNQVALIPKSLQQVVLIAHQNMRAQPARVLEAACQRMEHKFVPVQRCLNCGHIR